MSQNSVTPVSLGTDRLSKLLVRYAIPAIVATVTSALYNITDSIFIGQGVGPLAMSGLGICMPIMSITAAFGSMVGVGGSALTSIRLGQGNKASAFRILGNVVLLNIIFGVVTMVACLLFLNKLLYLFGASADTIGYAREYMVVLLAGNVVTHLYLGLNEILRASGYPSKSMMVMLTAVVINCILDPLFIFVFKWGIAGSAYATVIAQCTALAVEIVHFSSPKHFLHFRRSIFKLRRQITFKVLSIGAAPFLLQACASLVSSINNNALRTHGGDLYIGAFSIINRVMMLFVMIVAGLNQGMQPIIGYNYGAKLYDRVFKVLKMVIMCAVTATTTGFLCAELFPRQIAAIFGNTSTEMGQQLIDIAAHGMRIAFLWYPFVGFQIVASNFFQCIGKPYKAIMMSMTRQVLFLIPLLLFLPDIYGSDGVWMSMPIADCSATIVATILLFFQIRKLRRDPASDRSI